MHVGRAHNGKPPCYYWNAWWTAIWPWAPTPWTLWWEPVLQQVSGNGPFGCLGRRWDPWVRMWSPFVQHWAACDKGSQWRRSLQVLASSASSSVQLDNFAYSAVISACATAERWEFACGLLENLGKKAVLADLVTHGAVLKALGAGKEWAMALALFFDRTNHELSEVTQVTCNSVINACSTGSQWQHACLLLNSMPDLGVSPEDVSYNTAISGCVRGHAWQQGLMLFNQMHQALVEPDHISFNSALSACHKGSQVAAWAHLTGRDVRM